MGSEMCIRDSCGGSAELDECGVCDGVGLDNDACDCDISGQYYFDECGVCGGSGLDDDDDGLCDDVDDCIGEYDCAGTCNGLAIVDPCGICGGTNLDADNDGVCDGIDTNDDGICDVNCNDGCIGELDACGVCTVSYTHLTLPTILLV